ncbi:MAG: LPP20 family lipoprotein [Planctomycetota bacterium]
MRTMIAVTALGLALGWGCMGGSEPAPKKHTAPAPEAVAETEGARPAWIEAGETRGCTKAAYWLAVGSGDTPEAAAQSARQEVASQIRTQVRARITDMAASDGATVKERFESISQNITDARLEGLEIVEQFTGRRRSYALAGLDKAVYLGKIESQVKDLQAKAAAAFDQALQRKAEGVFGQYATLLGEALGHIQALKDPEYFYRSFRQGGSPAGVKAMALELTVVKEQNDFLAAVKAVADPAVIDGKAGAGLDTPLKAVFTAFDKPLANFPVSFTAVRGRVVMDAAQVTDAAGAACATVSMIERAPVKTVRILCRPGLGASTATRAAAAEFVITVDTVSRWVVFIDEAGKNGIVMAAVTGSMKDGGVDVNQLNLAGAFDEKALLEQVGQKLKGFCMVTGQFTAREVDTAMGSSTCRADGYVKGVEIGTGRILFHKAVENVIGISYTGNVDEGCRAALNTAGKQAAEIVKTELGY